MKPIVDHQTRQRDRQHLRSLLLTGGASPSVLEAKPAYFDSLRQRVHDASRSLSLSSTQKGV